MRLHPSIAAPRAAHSHVGRAGGRGPQDRRQAGRQAGPRQELKAEACAHTDVGQQAEDVFLLSPVLFRSSCSDVCAGWPHIAQRTRFCASRHVVPTAPRIDKTPSHSHE
jgi:hypothetical protein